MARPLKAAAPMTTAITLRLPPEQLAKWKVVAKEQDMSVADWVRTNVDPTMHITYRRTPQKRPMRLQEASPADPALIAKIAMMGNNMNQLARWANRFKSTADAAQILLALTAIEQQLGVLLEL